MNDQMIKKCTNYEELPPAISQILASMKKDYMEQPRKFRTNKAVLIESVEDGFPPHNLSVGCSYGLWEGYKHPNFFVFHPGKKELAEEVIQELVGLVLQGHVFCDEKPFGTFTSTDGQKHLIRGKLYGKGENAAFYVFFVDENGEYIGYPTKEQLKEMGLLKNAKS